MSLRRPLRWLRRTLPLRFETLEDRLAPTIEAIAVPDPRFQGDAAFGTSNFTGDSVDPIRVVSADGQRIVFQSAASNVVPNDDNGSNDVFVYDRGSGKTSLVSINASGTAASERGGSEPVITPDGRYVIFQSDSSDLVTSPSINNFFQGQPRLWWRDLVTGTTKLVNQTVDGQDGGAVFSDYAISDDGKFVVFISSSDQLVSSAGTHTGIQVYLRDMVAGDNDAGESHAGWKIRQS